MPFDAAALWWPPFSKLHNQLETLKLEPAAVPADALKSALAGAAALDALCSAVN